MLVLLATRSMSEPSRKRTVSVTPLVGAGTHGGGPRSCLVKLGGVRILIDCGWDCQFNDQQLSRLKEAVTNKDEPIDLVTAPP